MGRGRTGSGVQFIPLYLLPPNSGRRGSMLDTALGDDTAPPAGAYRLVRRTESFC